MNLRVLFFCEFFQRFFFADFTHIYMLKYM